MALDGITTAAIVTELKEKLIGGRIDKVHQPLADEIRFSVRAIGANYKVLASPIPVIPGCTSPKTPEKTP